MDHNKDYTNFIERMGSFDMEFSDDMYNDSKEESEIIDYFNIPLADMHLKKYHLNIGKQLSKKILKIKIGDGYNE